MLRHRRTGRQAFPDVGVVVSKCASLISANVRRADNGEAALIGGACAGQRRISRRASRHQSHGFSQAAVVIQRSQEWIAAENIRAAKGEIAGSVRVGRSSVTGHDRVNDGEGVAHGASTGPSRVSRNGGLNHDHRPVERGTDRATLASSGVAGESRTDHG